MRLVESRLISATITATTTPKIDDKIGDAGANAREYRAVDLRWSNLRDPTVYAIPDNSGTATSRTAA